MTVQDHNTTTFPPLPIDLFSAFWEKMAIPTSLWQRLLTRLIFVSCLLVAAVVQAGQLSRLLVNPNNHHSYLLLDSATWKDSEAEAVALGGHLATIRNQAEEDWIFKNFGSYGGNQHLLWVGLSDIANKFHFGWSSGESTSYTRWAPGEPNNVGNGEDFVAIYYPNHDQANKWNDWNDRTADPIGLPMNGVVEIIPKDTDRPTNAKTSADQATANTIAVQIGPSIVITNDSGSIKLQWPISATSYVLEATTALSQPFTMFGYSEATNTDSGVFSVTITNPVQQMFFRLRKP